LIFIVIAVICIYISSEPSNTPPVSKPVEYKIVLAKKAPTLESLHKSSEPLIDTRKIDDSKIQVKALLEDEIQLEQEQITTAMELINSADNEERIEGIELLGAYPNPESEAILTQLLTNDEASDIRNVAALSLGAFEVLLDSTINDLISALADESEDVRFSALSTLENYMLGLEEVSVSRKTIHSQLTAKTLSSELPQDTRDALTDILSDE
jgi:HEAT repeat protein